jgi:glycosyltransferase involved in cell wall biosynthesis
MLDNQKVVCVLPAYNAAKTLEKTIRDVPQNLVDLFILVDDASTDETIGVAAVLSKEFPIQILRHERNRGYGGNQKTCYQAALDEGADIVVMLHPDYQYEPRLLRSLVAMVSSGIYDVSLGSRILGNGALNGGMPLYKYLSNRVLTFIENLCIGQKLSEYHTGYRAFTRRVLRAVPFTQNSDDFVFDNEILVQCHLAGFRIGEVSVPTKYFDEASSINFLKSVQYGFGVLRCSLQGLFGRWGFGRYRTYHRLGTRGSQS